MEIDSTTADDLRLRSEVRDQKSEVKRIKREKSDIYLIKKMNFLILSECSDFLHPASDIDIQNCRYKKPEFMD